MFPHSTFKVGSFERPTTFLVKERNFFELGPVSHEMGLHEELRWIFVIPNWQHRAGRALSEPSSDEYDELLTRVALRDRAAFNRLYELSSGRLFGVALRMMKDRSQAEDLLQDAFIKIWQRADRFRPGQSKALGWMITLTRNLAIDRLRSAKPPVAPMEMAEGLPDQGLSPEGRVAANQLYAQIEACLGELEQQRAEAIRAAYVEGYSYNELAERFKTPLNTMRTWLRRSLLRLRSCLEHAEP